MIDWLIDYVGDSTGSLHFYDKVPFAMGEITFRIETKNTLSTQGYGASSGGRSFC